MVFERFAREYGWTPATCRRLTIRQIQTYWQAMHARYASERSATGIARPGKGAAGTSAGGARPVVEQSQTADGRTVRRYNLLSMWDRMRNAGT
ncbi:hypothetical protein HN371_05650 [Candidatus Poribacteria bacterium]|nr:hypothetical protein [Candidatus Poribacteria bacterium]MBT5531899.1 hypothetical protein [Candidatus Poribacteria bacterium]MBT7806267.1 hypothetical protein [Candidatus Poribacteria bacterium]